jgi:hypothetical protein
MMAIGFVYWLLMLLWFVLGGLPLLKTRKWPGGLDVLAFLLFAIIGWVLFGAPVHK